MSVVGSQQQTFLRLLGSLRPHWHRDIGLPARIQSHLAHRSFGSRDRRLYRELIYTALRYLPWIEPSLDPAPERAVKMVAWLAHESRATTDFRAALTADWPAPGSVRERAAFLDADVNRLLPSWIREECPSLFEDTELEAQLARAPLWLRIQTDDPNMVATELASHGWRWRESPVLPNAWQLLDEADVTKTNAYAHGAFEVQDLGSQLVLGCVGIMPGHHWLDGCAGAGGKTLQLARLLGPAGNVDAYDVRPAALDELVARALRVRDGSAAVHAAFSREHTLHAAGMAAIRVLNTAPRSDPSYNGVLVDAPCSGSGTWRRAPHLKWTTTRATVAEQAARQVSILDQHASAVRLGGTLVYATCSVARTENEAVVAKFLSAHPEFDLAPLAPSFGLPVGEHGMTILPAKYNTDGFFVAAMHRR